MRDYQALDPEAERGSPASDFEQKYTLGRLTAGYAAGDRVELRAWGTGMNVFRPGAGSVRNLREYRTVDDLVTGFKWRFWPWNTIAGAPLLAALRFDTKFPNTNERYFAGTNNIDLAFGALADLTLTRDVTLHLQAGLNIVGDPRRANHQDDWAEYRIALGPSAAHRRARRWGLAGGLQGYRGYYDRHDDKGRIFLQTSWRPGERWEVLGALTRQVYGDRAEPFEVFHFTEQAGVAVDVLWRLP